MSGNAHRRPRVLVADRIAPEGVDLLAEHCDVDVQLGMDQAEVMAIIGDYEGIVVRSATKLPAEVLARASNLRVIARAGAGLDTIDVDAAIEADIEVVNAPDANTVAVAELTLALMLSLARSVPQADASLKEGRWDKPELLGTGLAGKVLGIVGYGRIGREVASRARAFGMQVLANQRRPTPELQLREGVTPVDLPDLLEQADFVTIHVPATDETQHLVDADFLAGMRPDAWLINTARGSVVDEQALLDALEADRIAGAALDVFREEPAVDSALARHSKVVATPHIGASTVDAQVEAATTVARQVIDLLADTEPATVLPLRVIEVDDLVPHEAHDDRRVERLRARLEADGILRNPPIVTEVDDRYVVLDGATRSEAVRRTGAGHVVVQVASVADGLDLETWSHVLTGIDFDEVGRAVAAVDGLVLDETTSDEAIDRLLEVGGVCALVTPDDRAAVVEADRGMNRFRAAEAATAAYTRVAEVTRTLDRDITELAVRHPSMDVLVVFPHYSVEQVLLAARSGQLLPAGVTRFVVPGRVLHLDVELEWLRSDQSLRDKNRKLHRDLRELQQSGGVRYYREPVYLLSE